MNRITKIARNVVVAETKKVDSPAEKAIKDEIRENLKNVLKCCKDFDNKTVAKGCEHDIREVADLLGIKL